MIGNIPPILTNWGPASATSGGMVTTGAQTFAGAKTFDGAATFGSTVTVAGVINAASMIRVTGVGTPPATGVGLETYFTAGSSYVSSYDRTGGAAAPLGIYGSIVTLAPGGGGFTAAATVNTHAVPVQMKTYTVATLPASPAAGLVAYASDAGGNGPCIAMGNGSVWKRCDNTSTTVA